MTDNKPPNVSGTYSLVPGIAGADFAQDGDGVTLDTKVALINRVFKCVFRTPLAASMKGEFHTLLFNSSMDRLLAAHRSAKGVELGMWSNEPATWHGTGVLLDKLDEGWHTLSLASIKNLSCIYLDGTCSPPPALSRHINLPNLISCVFLTLPFALANIAQGATLPRFPSLPWRPSRPSATRCRPARSSGVPSLRSCSLATK